MSKLYTLSEAKVELAKQECERTGHNFKIELMVDGREPKCLSCSRCGAEWRTRVKA